jgi:hypothetical protein
MSALLRKRPSAAMQRMMRRAISRHLDFLCHSVLHGISVGLTPYVPADAACSRVFEYKITSAVLTSMSKANDYS